MALWRGQGTDHALFDRSEKPLDDLAMICSAAVGGRGRKGGRAHEKGCAVPGTRNQGRPQKKKSKKRRGQCNALQCKCNATQTEGGRGIIDKIQCKGGVQILDLAVPYCLLPQRCLFQSPAENETSRRRSRDASRVRQHEKYCFSSLQITIHIITRRIGLVVSKYASQRLDRFSITFNTLELTMLRTNCHQLRGPCREEKTPVRSGIPKTSIGVGVEWPRFVSLAEFLQIMQVADCL